MNVNEANMLMHSADQVQAALLSRSLREDQERERQTRNALERERLALERQNAENATAEARARRELQAQGQADTLAMHGQTMAQTAAHQGAMEGLAAREMDLREKQFSEGLQPKMTTSFTDDTGRVHHVTGTMADVTEQLQKLGVQPDPGVKGRVAINFGDEATITFEATPKWLAENQAKLPQMFGSFGKPRPPTHPSNTPMIRSTSAIDPSGRQRLITGPLNDPTTQKAIAEMEAAGQGTPAAGTGAARAPLSEIRVGYRDPVTGKVLKRLPLTDPKNWE